MIVVAIALAVVVIAVIVVRALTGSDTSQSEQDPIVGDWTVVVNQSDVEISFEVREDGSFALTKPLPGGKFLGILMDGDGWNDLVSGLRWERGPFEGGVQRYRLYFEGDTASVLGLDVVSGIEAQGIDMDAFLKGSTFEFWIPLSFPDSAAGGWGFRFLPAPDGLGAFSGCLGVSEVEMRLELNKNGELVAWDPIATDEDASPVDSWILAGEWGEKANHGGASEKSLSVELVHVNGNSVKIDFSSNQVS
ncbi:hypothetical protein [Parvibacter caecicola]|uniref:hypothetical protein n=1 Tax=Parvibacter caecicola TaxID=747645 RepID=UPI002499B18F|nr:hypothetical protein [Parvibacter caecicola]